MRAPQQLLLDKVAEEGAVGAADFAHMASRKNIIYLILN